MEKNHPPRVLIVGAGPSGLAAVKEMRAAGVMQVVCVEARSEIGGVFSRNSNVTYENLYLTIPNFFMAFSDFPPPDGERVKYWSKDEYTDYLERYVIHFDLEDSIELNTCVQEATYEASQWHVRTITKQGASKERTFDYLIVATGANHTPRLPTFPGFSGNVIHGSEYTSCEQVRDKRVLVVGMGESAVDAAVSARRSAKSSAIWSRRSPDMPPRFLTEFMENPNYDEEEYLSKQEHLLPKDALECITTSRIVRNLPLGIWGCCLHGFIGDMKSLHGKDSPQGSLCEIHEESWASDYFSADTALVPCKSGVLYGPAKRGELDIVVAPTMECNGTAVTFEQPSFFGSSATTDPSKEIQMEVDVIVACTGYQLKFSDWLKAPIAPSPRTWFMHCFPPNGWGDKIAFLGYARPHQGGIPQLAEMMARYVAQILIGNLSLPKDYDMIALQEGSKEQECFHKVPHYELLVDYHAFMLNVATRIGCEPMMPNHSIDSLVKYWTFPLWPCFFRTQGPGADLKAFSNVVDRFGPFDALAPMPLLAVQILFTFVMPLVNGLSYALDSLLQVLGNKSRRALPFGYKWRMSKSLFLYSNMIKCWSAEVACGQVIAGLSMLVHCFTKIMSLNVKESKQE